MDLILNKENDIRKKSFAFCRHSHSDGLVLNVHHTDNNLRRLRFIHTCFNSSGDLLASADSKGNLFLIDVTKQKFWGLPTLNSCTLIQFSTYRYCEILIGLNTNVIVIMNFEIGNIKGKLIGHKSVPCNISFSHCTFCLTSSKTEAIIWDLQYNYKLKILSLEEGALLKHVSFLPNSIHIIGCYTDDMLNIWEFGSFKILRVIPNSIWNNLNIKYFALSYDSSVMAVSSNNPVLAIYSLKHWKLLKFIDLPEHVKSIKLLKFISFKNNSRTILAILSGDGIILFLDTIENIVISELKAQHEIIKFDHVDHNIYLSCVLCTGYIQIYNLTSYIEKPVKVPALTEKKLKVKFQQKTSPRKIEELKEELDDVLNIDKLRAILKEFGEYPEAYRTLIWEQLLQLPNNTEVYDGIKKYQVQNAFQNVDIVYQVDNRSIKYLKILLSNLVTWCGFFSHVHYLPVFVYPFLKVFQNRPIVCFEAIVTILLNWCQYWFEYFPLHPINVMGIIENIFLEWDPHLLCHLSENGITSKEYAWPLLESAFSEVLTSQAWYVFWDHVLTNEPSFLICTVVAYNIIERNNLLNIRDKIEFELFYHKQNPLDIRKFVAKCYSIMNKTNKDIHPRKYLNVFTKLEKDAYPEFRLYPKVIIDSEAQKLTDLKKDLQDIELVEAESLLNKKKEIDKLLDSDLETIERKRLFEMKKACNEKLQDQQVQAKEHLQRLTKLRQKFDKHQAKVLQYSKSEQLRNRLETNEMLCSEIETNQKSDDYEAEKSKTLLLRHYSELMRHKTQIEALLQDESSSIDDSHLYEKARKEHKEIIKEMKKISEYPEAEVLIRQYNIVSSLVAMEDLIKKVESALAKELSNEYLDLVKSESCLKNIHLQSETKLLETEVNNLLNALSKAKFNESRSKLSTGTSTIPLSIGASKTPYISEEDNAKHFFSQNYAYSQRKAGRVSPPSKQNYLSSKKTSQKITIEKAETWKKNDKCKKKMSDKSVRFSCSNMD